MFNKMYLWVTLLFCVNFVFANQITEFSFESNLSDNNKFGNVSIIKESDVYPMNLLVNHKKIDVNAYKDNFYIMHLSTKIDLPKVIIYIVWGGTIDMDSNKQCKFLVLESGITKISNLTYCKQFKTESQLFVDKNGLIDVYFKNINAYAESNDFGVIRYNYKNNMVQIIKPTKSDSYYKKKFENLTPRQIYQEAQANDGVNTQNGFIDTSHVNMYGQRYCFKFEVLKNPPHDKYYTLLKKSCLN